MATTAAPKAKAAACAARIPAAEATGGGGKHAGHPFRLDLHSRSLGSGRFGHVSGLLNGCYGADPLLTALERTARIVATNAL